MTLTQSDRQVVYAAQAIKRRQSREAKRARVMGVVKPGDRVREPLYLAFIRRQPCAIHGLVGHVCEGRVEAAHVRYASAAHGKPITGLQIKPDDRFAVPLCRAAHREGKGAQHSRGERLWWEARGLDPLKIAGTHYQQYRSET